MERIAYQRIEKEQIRQFAFVDGEVLSDRNDQHERTRGLERARTLGNSYKSKVIIRFVTTSGPMEVYTTIWDLSRNHVGLKNGALIPVHAIVSVSH